jgi:hypothetical protein
MGWMHLNGQFTRLRHFKAVQIRAYQALSASQPEIQQAANLCWKK